MPRKINLLFVIGYLLVVGCLAARADSVVLATGSTLTVNYAGTSGDFGPSYTPRTATGSAITIFTLSNDGLTLEVRFRNTSEGIPSTIATTRWLDEFNFYSNVAVSNQGQFISMPARAVWQTSFSFSSTLGQNIGIGTRLLLFEGNGLIQGEEGLVRFSFASPVTSLSLTPVFCRLHFITTDGEGATFAYGIEARPISIVYTPPSNTIPEPATLILLGGGLAFIGGKAFRKKRADATRE